jgi:hypothetical protein
MTLEAAVQQRGIQHLVHFTTTFNLYGMFQAGGVLSRKCLEASDVDTKDIMDFVKFTDEKRYDDPSYINCSIEECNHGLFNTFQQKTKDEMDVHWCVLKLDAAIMMKPGVLFSRTNAANSHNKRTGGIRPGVAGFEALFLDELEVRSSRSNRRLTRHRLSPSQPTDEQAEVLIQDKVGLEAIRQICFLNKEELAECKAAFDSCGFDTSKFVVDPSMFRSSRR